ncbi:MAG: hypothetical protein JNL70_24735 [Saprospiraceae bacterium]|nr:hypothetical protein [Saprospiraceae bacterium]
MKNILSIIVVIVLCVSSAIAQSDSRFKTRLPSASGLKVEIKTSSSVTVQELPNPADMFYFKVFEVYPGTPNSNSLACTSRLVEVGGFQVNAQINLTQLIGGGKSYSFILTGLKAGQQYGVDVFPVNNRLSAPQYLTLIKMGYTSGGFCNPSVVNGSPIRIQFQAVAPPK